MIVAGPALPHQSAIRIPQINANQSSIPDWKVLARTRHCAAAAPLPRCCFLCPCLCCSALFTFSPGSFTLVHSLREETGIHGTQQTQHAARRTHPHLSPTLCCSVQLWCASGSLRPVIPFRGPESWPGHTSVTAQGGSLPLHDGEPFLPAIVLCPRDAQFGRGQARRSLL